MLNQVESTAIMVVGRWWDKCIWSGCLDLAKFWTLRGIKILGVVVKKAREERGWTVRDIERLTDEISNGDYKISRDTMSDFERGIRIPAHNTVVVLAKLKFAINPVTGKPFTEDELSDIAAEVLDPETGCYKLRERKLTIAALISLEIKNRPWLLKRLAFSNLAAEAGLEMERLEAIYSGERPTDEELVKLACVLTKDNGTHWQEAELSFMLESQFQNDGCESNTEAHR